MLCRNNKIILTNKKNMNMKKTFWVLALFHFSIFNFQFAHAQQVVSDGFDHLQVSYKTVTPEVQHVAKNYDYTLLTLPGYTTAGEVGAPVLPVRSDIIEVPFCDDIVVTVENAVYDTIQLSQNSILYPLQPSRSKSDTSADKPLVFNEKVYETDAFYGLSLAEVEVMGVARDRRLAKLCYSPVQVNPVTGQVVVCRSADITVSYVAADVDGTVEHYRRYHTPAFSVGTTLNNLFSSVKQSGNQTIRMAIAVPNSLRCDAIERFANWKRRQGFLVDFLYYHEASSSNSALAERLKSLFDTASDAHPAPAYLLIVGDHNQIPAFNSQISSSGYYDVGSDHVTDLYFVTWTADDYLPDCYQGRFSATDTATLADIVNKTLLYERYAFDDDAYLARAALIAGEDNAQHSASGWSTDYAWVYADPTMDYIAYNYVNAANGFDQVFYYKNDTSYAPTGVTITGYCSATASASALRNLYNTGIGWINYSAHGDWNEWHKPSFTVTQVSVMSNNGMPSFMIGNCCLSNKFNKPTCFGEALLRKNNNAGAVAYIGGTNSTYWEQDLDWSVGVRTNISHTMSPTYNVNNLGTYDRLFHTHSEPFEEHVSTAGAMVYFGNLAVNASSPSSYTPNMKKYYWEIYELMGDPSLMPWMGRASDLPMALVSNGNTLTVTTQPHAYVALVDTASLRPLSAGHSDESGHLSIDLSSVSDMRGVLLSASAQNYKPYFRLFATDPLGIDSQLSAINAQLSIFPNPASDHVIISGLPVGSTVELYDATGRRILTLNSQLSTLNLQDLPSSLYLLRVCTPEGIIVRKIVKQ